MTAEFDIALRVQAKLDEARRALQGLKSAVQELGTAGADVNVKLPDAAAAQKSAESIKQTAQALDEQSAAVERTAAAERRRAEVLARTAPTAEQEARLAAAKQQLAAGAEKAGAATDKESAALARLIGNLDPTTSRTQQLTQAQEQLNKALAQGSITQDQHTRFMAQAQQRWASSGNTAKQTAAAMRMLPAQITDITTSLASGMPVWLVAIQQGGQIKDSFGGIGPALRGIGSLIRPTTVAFGALGATVAAVTVAYVQGQRETDALRNSIVMSGNAAGVTTASMYEMARATSDVVGTQGKAIKSLQDMAASGVVARDNMQQFVQTALMLDVVGKSAESTVKEIVELGKSPVEASVKLNEQYGYLTAAVYEQILALSEQGRESDAANLAQETYATAMERRARDLTEQLGWVQKAWNSIASAAASAWDRMLDIGRPDSTADILAKARKSVEATEAELERLYKQRDYDLPQREIAGIADYVDPNLSRRIAQEEERLAILRSTVQAQSDQLQRQEAIARAEALHAQAQKDGIQAIGEQNKLIESGLSKQAKLEKALAENRERIEKIRRANPDSELLTAESIAASEKAIREKYKETGRVGPRNNSLTAQVRADLRTLQDAVKQSDALLVQAVEQGTMGINAAYRQRITDLQQSTEAQRQALQGELENPKTTKVRRIEIQAQLKLLKSSATKTAADIEKWRKDQQRALQDLQVRLRIDVAALTGEFDAEAIRRQLEAQYADMRIAVGRADDPAEAAAAVARIDMLIEAGAQQAAFNAKLQETQRLQSNLALLEESISQQADKGQISRIEAEARINAARAAQIPLLQQIALELERIRDAVPPEAATVIDGMTENIGKLRNEVAGATPVLVDFGTRLRNTAIDGLADAAATAVTEFHNLRDAAATTLKQIAADIVRSNIKSLLTDAFTPGKGSSGGGWFSAAVSGVRSIFGFADGGLIRGPGTGTSDSIPALVDGRMPIAVSNEEFIQPHRAVKHYGVGFMEAIRTLRLPKPQYAFGGLVSASQRVRYATGGVVNTGTGTGNSPQSPISVEVRFTNQGTAKQMVGDPRITQDSGRMVIEAVIADAVSNGRGIRAIKAAVRNPD